MSDIQENNSDIAIVGMSGAFPGAESIDEFWENLLAGKSGFEEVSDKDLEEAAIPKEVYDRVNYVKKAAPMSAAKCFDAEFFGYSANEAKIMDPQHRVFLEHSWLALENAGYIPDECEGVVGVYGGSSLSRYLLTNMNINTQAFDIDDFQKMLANDKDYLTTRVSHRLNLTGPSINVQSACSTSLLAVQMGVLSLQTFQCDVALCGGVTINTPHKVGYIYSEGMIFSPDGHCRPFCDDANGTVFGEGVGVVVLKRLQDALESDDNIVAIIKSAAVNNDGRDKVGFTAPSMLGQSEVISIAQELAEVSPEQICFIETHGTATAMGDPIELAGLKKVFGRLSEGKPFCALGTLKANIGHLDAAAGVASLIKTALIAKHKIIPPSFSSENQFPRMDEEGTPFYFNADIVDLNANKMPLYLGVSSFGVGGTNVHAILTSPPTIQENNSVQLSDNRMLVFSAKSEASVTRQQNMVVDYLEAHPEDISDAAYSLFEYRKRFEYRSFVLAIEKGCGEPQVKKYRAVIKSREVVKTAFAFSGQSSQYVNMTKELYSKVPVYKSFLNECFDLLEQQGQKKYQDILFVENNEGDNDLSDTETVQVSLFITEYSLAKTLIYFGLVPDVMLGHSLGEYVAATLAGVFSLKDAIKVVCARGRLMSSSPKGGMLVIHQTREIIEALIGDALTIAIENSAENVVVAGMVEEINLFTQILDKESIQYTRLKNEHPFHTVYMESVLDAFREIINTVDLRSASIPLISATPGYTGKDMSTSEYWVQHIRKEVNFHAAVRECIDKYEVDTVLEVGPGGALCSFFNTAYPVEDLLLVQTVPSKPKILDTIFTFYGAIASLWCRGLSIDLYRANFITEARQIPLPGYQFLRNEHWLDPISDTVSRVRTVAAPKNFKGIPSDLESGARHDLDRSLLSVWQHILGIDELTIDDNFFELGGDSVTALKLVKDMHKATGLTLASSILFECPTIRLIVDEGSEGIKKAASVLSLNGVEAGVPLFCLCGVQIYKEFADYFSDIPVYGMYAEQEIAVIQQESGMEDQISIKNLVDAYVDAIKRQLKGKKFSLVGLSFGGLLALEVAKEMKAMGFDVEHVVLFDSYLATSHRRTLLQLFKDFSDRAKKYGIKTLFLKIQKRLFNRINKGLVRNSNGGWSHQSAEAKRGAAFYKIASFYEENGKEFDFDVLLIKAARTTVGFGFSGKQDYGLKKIIKGRLGLAEVDADHVDMIKGRAARKVHEIVYNYMYK
jgi:acyl transferase domain-containing protein/thioesterase domain-containing protein